MREEFGDLWQKHAEGHWACVTTNGLQIRGRAIMGRGVALQASRRFKRLGRALGARLAIEGNHVFLFPEERLVTFPVKHHWAEDADLELIERSARELVAAFDGRGDLRPQSDLVFARDEMRITAQGETKVILPRPGCGNGRRSWAEVRPVLAPILPDWVIVIDRLLEAC